MKIMKNSSKKIKKIREIVFEMTRKFFISKPDTQQFKNSLFKKNLLYASMSKQLFNMHSLHIYYIMI